MTHVNLKDITRPYNEEFDLFRRILFQSGEYQIKCLISFPDSFVEYSASVPGSLMKVTATARKNEPLIFSLNNVVLFAMNSKKELDAFLEEMQHVRRIYEAVEELDARYNTLRNINGPWTKDRVQEVKAYV